MPKVVFQHLGLMIIKKLGIIKKNDLMKLDVKKNKRKIGKTLPYPTCYFVTPARIIP